ncbi:unnamed protein product [Penicillium salamii]|nr:unnamed protein product [Penicillium salamii]CAG8410561.1 unnamed protein product [Penicillium salamii]
MITADSLTSLLITSFPSDFEGISQYGHIILAFKLAEPEETARLVQLEVFDQKTWPQRPQYNLQTATRTTLNINGQVVKLFSAEWLLREKMLSQYQCQGNGKEDSDIRDLVRMIRLVVTGTPELNFDQNPQMQAALANLLQKRPGLAKALEAKIKCSASFQV